MAVPPMLVSVRFAAWASARVFVLLGLIALLCFVSVPLDRAAHAASQGPGSVSIVAAGVTDDATASNNQVKLARDPSGRLFVAYAAIVGGSHQVVLAMSRDNGARWEFLAQASSGDREPSRLPAVALDGAGRLHVVWTYYADGVGKVYYRVWAGGRWTAPPELISRSKDYAGYPALALDRPRHPRVAWYGIRLGTTPVPTRHSAIYEIYYTGYDGHAWSPPLRISTDLPDAINPAMAADRTGRMHAAWYQFDGRAYRIRYAVWSGTWHHPEGVSGTRSDEFNPDLVVDAQGRVSLAWEQHDGQASTIQYARRSDGRWDGPVALSTGASPALHPSVTSDPSGEVYVAWEQQDGQIYMRRFAGRWDPVVRLTSDGGNTFPSALADTTGVSVVWTHTTADYRSSVFFAWLPRR